LGARTGIVVALPMSLYVMRRMRTSRHWGRAAALVSALFFSFNFYNGRDRGFVEETEHKTKRKKDDQSGEHSVPPN
jgi:hypothetical protein